MKRLLVATALIALMGLVPAGRAAADDKDNEDKLQAKPFVFVGSAADCGGTAGSNIVTAAWLRGMGLPDDGGNNAPNPATRNDPHRGLLLSKNGPTADCSAAGARISGVKGMTVTATFELGFDYRNGGHCGAGAPRFNVVAKPASGPETFHFVGGCANDQTPAGAPQDSTQWTRVRFQTGNPAESFPVIPVGSRIVSISLIFDEGTDTANAPGETTAGAAGLAVVDNININGSFIRQGDGVQPGEKEDQEKEDDD